MRRPLRPDETRLWAVVAATVELAPGRTIPDVEPELTPPARPAADLSQLHTAIAQRRPAPSAGSPETIEPQRLRRIARGRDPIDARIDLHGLTQDRARQALMDFLLRAQTNGFRAVLVITGKGVGGDGVLRRRTPEWLTDPALRKIIAGLSTAERHHGGEGALYVALKRKTA